MDEKRGRGRPKVSEKIVGSLASKYETIMTNGKDFRSRRSISDTVYAMQAVPILLEVASEIEGLELILKDDERYMCRSIMNQLGRMSLAENYDKESVITIAKMAIYKKQNGCSVKEIEKYIRHGRLTGQW